MRVPWDEPFVMETPCVGICTLDAKREHCTGCMRTVDEIANWSKMTQEERIAIIDRVWDTVLPPINLLNSPRHS